MRGRNTKINNNNDNNLVQPHITKKHNMEVS